MPIGALFVVAEMVLYTGLELAAGGSDTASMIYWLVVAAICGFIAYGRLVLEPHPTV